MHMMSWVAVSEACHCGVELIPTKPVLCTGGVIGALARILESETRTLQKVLSRTPEMFSDLKLRPSIINLSASFVAGIQLLQYIVGNLLIFRVSHFCM